MLLDHAIIDRSKLHAHEVYTIFQIKSIFNIIITLVNKIIIQIIDYLYLPCILLIKIFKPKSHFGFYSDDG